MALDTPNRSRGTHYCPRRLSGLGRLPDMYGPAWYPEKTLSAIAGATAVAACALLPRTPTRRDSIRSEQSAQAVYTMTTRRRATRAEDHVLGASRAYTTTLSR